MVKEIIIGDSLGSQYKKPTREEKIKMSAEELAVLPEQVISDASNQFVGLHNIFKILKKRPTDKELLDKFKKGLDNLEDFERYVDINYDNYLNPEKKKIIENVKRNYQDFFTLYNTYVRMLKNLSENNYLKEAKIIFKMIDRFIADIRQIEQSE